MTGATPNALDAYAHLRDKNSALRGRKRFAADLADLAHAVAEGAFAVRGMRAAGTRDPSRLSLGRAADSL
jgi:hypothetical protein